MGILADAWFNITQPFTSIYMTATTDKPAWKAEQTAIAPTTNINFELKDVIKSIPRKCFEKNRVKAWFNVFLSIAAVSLGYIGIAYSPWYLLPVAWFFTGTALTGWFVIAHDCGHRSFAQRRWVNDVVGHLLMLPLIYPFHSWRLLHNHHHAHTNKMEEDNAWRPWTPEEYASASPFMQGFYRSLRGQLWWLASIAHWATLHFDPRQVEPRHRNQVKLSIAVVVIFAAICFPALILTTGVWGFVKFWLMPWLGYHFWMSTFTLVHHTDPEVQFYPAAQWNEAYSQLAGTLHCTYPRWVEILCHNINVHVPHHVSVAIPSYNLPMAYASLKQNWGEYIQERQFSWAMMQTIVDRCHLYDPVVAYQPFDRDH